MNSLGNVTLRNNTDEKQHVVAVYPREVKPGEVPRLHPEWPEEFFAIAGVEEKGLITAHLFKFGQQAGVGVAVLKKNEKGELEPAC